MEIKEALKTGKISKILAVMISGSEGDIKMIENGDFFKRNLCNDPDFVEALEKASERDVNIRILLSPPLHYPPTYSDNQILMNRLVA